MYSRKQKVDISLVIAVLPGVLTTTELRILSISNQNLSDLYKEVEKEQHKRLS